MLPNTPKLKLKYYPILGAKICFQPMPVIKHKLLIYC